MTTTTTQQAAVPVPNGTPIQLTPQAHAALRYAAAGIHVFPVRVTIINDGGKPRKKTEYPGRWSVLSTTDAPTVTGWWNTGSTWGNTSIGIDCAKSGLVIVDCDGTDGIKAWEEIRPPDSATYMAATPGGGEHWYYRAHPEHKVTIDQSGKVAPHVDVRGYGGLIIAPPSTDSRGAYRWLGGEPVWAELPVVPDIVIERMTKRPKDPPTQPSGEYREPREQPSGPRRFTDDEAAAFIAPAMDELRKAPDGQINGRLNNAAKVISHFVPSHWSRAMAEAMLLDALSHTVYDAATWQAEATIASAFASADGDWHAERVEPLRPIDDELPPQGSPGSQKPAGDQPPYVRRVDLGPWLDGTYQAPEPVLGAARDDGALFLYAGKWHTVIGPTEAGKTMFGLVHARDELIAGRYVIWVHFEELNPSSTVARLVSMGAPVEAIRERFVWLSADRRWLAGEFPAEVSTVLQLAQEAGTMLGLIGLDGINAACTSHGQDPSKPEAVGWYRSMFVRPGMAAGAAVLSLGHPVKDRSRQDERHGYGSSAWLDEVDGVGFRLMPSKTAIRRGAKGSAALYCVKDRDGSVRKLGVEDKREGWTYLGSLVIDDTSSGTTFARISVPDQVTESGAESGDVIDHLILAVIKSLTKRDGKYNSQNQLAEFLRADAVKFTASDLGAALERMESSGQIERKAFQEHKARPGWLRTASHDPDGWSLF